MFYKKHKAYNKNKRERKNRMKFMLDSPTTTMSEPHENIET